MSIWWRHQPKRSAWGRDKYWRIHWQSGGMPNKIMCWPWLTAIKDRARDAFYDRKYRHGNLPLDPFETLIRQQVRMKFRFGVGAALRGGRA